MVSNDQLLGNLKHVREFLDVVAPTLPAYRHAVFSYVAVNHNGEKAILRARLELATAAPALLKECVETPNLWAGQAHINLDAAGVEACIRCAVSNTWLPQVDNQLLKLLPKELPDLSKGYDAYYEPGRVSHGGLEGSIHRLVLGGINQFQLLSKLDRQLDKDLHNRGIDGVVELMRIYALSGSEESTLEIVAPPVAAFDSSSRVEGRHVTLGFSLALNLPRESFNIAARNADPNARDIPRTLNGRHVAWVEHSDHASGRWEFELRHNEVIDCRAVYDGCVQAQRRMADPKALPNRLRMMINLVDPECSRLVKVLTDPTRKQNEDFEAGIGWLLEVLGFATIHVSALSNMKDEPDILAIAPAGEVLVVECTIGVPDDDKLTMLISRVARMTRLWESQSETASGGVIPILVTARPRSELRGILAKAEEHGIILLCKAEIEEAVARSEFKPDADAVLRGWRGLGLMRLMTGEQPLGN